MHPPSGEPVRWPRACKTLTEECTKVKKIIGLSVLICLASFAQEKGRGGQPQGGGRPAAVGGGHIPARGPQSRCALPRPHEGNRPPPFPRTAFAQTRKVIRNFRTFTPITINGWDITAVPTMRITNSLSRGHTDASLVALDRNIYSTLREATGNASGLTTSTGTSPRTITTSS